MHPWSWFNVCFAVGSECAAFWDATPTVLQYSPHRRNWPATYRTSRKWRRSLRMLGWLKDILGFELVKLGIDSCTNQEWHRTHLEELRLRPSSSFTGRPAPPVKSASKTKRKMSSNCWSTREPFGVWRMPATSMPSEANQLLPNRLLRPLIHPTGDGRKQCPCHELSLRPIPNALKVYPDQARR